MTLSDVPDGIHPRLLEHWAITLCDAVYFYLNSTYRQWQWGCYLYLSIYLGGSAAAAAKAADAADSDSGSEDEEGEKKEGADTQVPNLLWHKWFFIIDC